MAGNVSTGSLSIKSSNPRSEEEGANKATDASQVMDDSTASKVHVTID